jgi:aspartyl-tRNA(Asn)/glutamyl-tRNA(Gln) amidotransferase subunit C
MQITDELLDKIASLARLEIRGSEREAMKQDFQKMLDFVDKLKEVDTEGIAPLIHMTEGVNRLSPDEPLPPLDRDDVLKNAPDKRDGHFRVPKVISR